MSYGYSRQKTGHDRVAGLPGRLIVAGGNDIVPLRVLLLGDWESPNLQNAILQSINSLTHDSRHFVVPFDPRQISHGGALSFDDFDVLAIHYTLCIAWDSQLTPAIARKIRDFTGLKVQFIQDEYRMVDRINDRMVDLGIHVLFTLATGKAIRQLYHRPELDGVRFESLLPGYVPDELIGIDAPPLSERPIDVGYRAREVPPWWGRSALDKTRIADRFLAVTAHKGLTTDISYRTEDRIYGNGWYDFIASCRAMLGVEAGTSIADFNGEAEEAAKTYQARHPTATTEEILEKALPKFDGNVSYLQLSPRVFEAAALRTAMIMYPGYHSGVVEPWTHYLPLERGMSNIDDIVAKLKDDAFLTAMTDRAYEDLIAGGAYSYTALVQRFDGVLDKEIQKHRPSNAMGRQRTDVTWRDRQSRRLERARNFDAIIAEYYMLPIFGPSITLRQKCGGGIRLVAFCVGMLKSLMDVSAVKVALTAGSGFWPALKSTAALKRFLSGRYADGSLVFMRVEINNADAAMRLVVEKPSARAPLSLQALRRRLKHANLSAVVCENGLDWSYLHPSTPQVKFELKGFDGEAVRTALAAYVLDALDGRVLEVGID